MRQRIVGVGEAALKGALAGAVGGLALVAAEELLGTPRSGRGGRVRDEWSTVATKLGRGAGVQLRGRRRTAAGIGMHVIVSAVLGAAYGAAMSGGRLGTPLRGLVEAGLVYGAYLAERPRRLSRAGRRKKRARKDVLPIPSHDLFGTATAQLFRALIKV